VKTNGTISSKKWSSNLPRLLLMQKFPDRSSNHVAGSSVPSPEIERSGMTTTSGGSMPSAKARSSGPRRSVAQVWGRLV
jgi:hypothetical protein